VALPPKRRKTKMWDLTQTVMDNYANSKRDETPRDYLGASGWGHACKRKLAYDWHRVPTDQPPFSPELFAIFAMGHAGEPVVVEILRAGGFDILTESAKTGKQFGFYAAEGKLRGHCDGIINGGPATKDDGKPLLYPMLWENKMLNNKSWNKTAEKGVKASKPIYYSQMQTYCAYFDIPNGSLFSSMNRDTGELYLEHVPFDADNAQASSDRALDVIQSETPEEFQRINSDPAFFTCLYCDYRLRCHQLT
jgi:hypothetical protein